MAARQAVCYFCSKPDDSIQVVCETRCLICSRCQLSPVMRKLFIDSLDAASSSFFGTDDSNFQTLPTSPTLRATSSPNSAAMLASMSGSCPICCMNLSVGMLRLIQGYKEALRHQSEDESSGKSPPSFELEEISPLIPNFLRRFKTTYEVVNEKTRGGGGGGGGGAASETVFDPSDPFAGVLTSNSLPTTPSTPNTTMNNLTGLNSTSKLSSVKKLPSDTTSANDANKMSSMGMMEFLIDCYCAQWNNVLRNGNDSMVTVMMRAATKKKFSQKTNDLKIKSIIDFLLSASGSENPEFILFGYLVGLKPKPTTKISAAWSHIATTLIMTITFDRMQSIHQQELAQKANLSYTAAPVTIVSADVKQRMLKQLESTLGAQFNRPCSIKKALKVVKSLINNKHPYFVMASLTARCIEYQCKQPWNSESLSKLFTIWLYVLWFEGMNNTNGNNTGKGTEVNTSTKTNKGVSRRNSDGFATTTSGNNDPPPSSSSSPPSRNMTRRSSSVSGMVNQFNASMEGTIPSGKPFGNRMEMLQGLDPIIERVWKSSAHPYLKFNTNPSNTSSMQLQYQQQGAYDYVMQLDSIILSNQQEQSSDCYYLNLSEEVFQTMVESYTMSIHELAILIIRCWEVEYGSVKQALNKGMLTSQRRTAIVGSYDMNKATMTAKEKLALTRLLHFYREDTSDNQSGSPMATSATLPSVYQKYPGLYQFRGIDWDEVEKKCHSNFYPFHIPQTLLTKSRVELNVLAEQVTNMLISQQIKDIEDDLAVKARLAKEEEENKLPDLIEFVEGPPSPPQDSEEESEEEKEHFIEHMLDVEKEVEEQKKNPKRPKPNHRLAMIKSHSLGPSTFNDAKAISLEDKQYETMLHGGHSRLPLKDDTPVLTLSSHLPRTDKHAHHDETMRDVITAGGLARTVSSPTRPLSSTRPLTKSMPDLHGMIQPLAGSEVPHVEHEPARLGHVLHYPKQQVTMVELIDNNALALNQAKMLPNTSRPTSALRPPRELRPEDKLSYPSGVHLQSLEKTVQDFPTMEDYNLTNNKRPSSRHQVRIESQITDPFSGSNKIYVDDERHRLPEKKDFESTPPIDPYKKSLEDYKKNKIIESRARILQRTMSTSSTAGAIDNMQPEWKAAYSNTLTSGGAQLREDEEDNRSIDEPTTPTLSAADVIGQFSRPTTSERGHSSQKRHRIVPYINLAKFINQDGEFVMDMTNNLIAESSIQYLTLRDAKINLRSLQQVVKLFMKDWQAEYMKIIDLSGNPGLQSTAARLISQSISTTCNLIHVNLNQVGIGDAGLKMLLNGIIQGNGAQNILRLDLQENQITMASDAMSLLQCFSKLKALDLSKNFFTLDTNAQMRYLDVGLGQCKSLEMLSVSFNKIQDNGFRCICNIIEKHGLPIKILDAAGCFITNKSADVLKNVLMHCARLTYNPNDGSDSALQALHKSLSPSVNRDKEVNVLFKLEKVFLHRNIFSHAVWDELLCDYQMGTTCKLLVNEPHTGIEIFPVYNLLRDFGILAPTINPAIM